MNTDKQSVQAFCLMVSRFMELGIGNHYDKLPDKLKDEFCFKRGWLVAWRGKRLTHVRVFNQKGEKIL